jgi:hypothetical protein
MSIDKLTTPGTFKKINRYGTVPVTVRYYCGYGTYRSTGADYLHVLRKVTPRPCLKEPSRFWRGRILFSTPFKRFKKALLYHNLF